MIRRTDLTIRICVVAVLAGLSLWRILPLRDNLKLGLDLQGGMYLVVKADTERIPKASVSKRSAFDKETLDVLIDNEIVRLSDDKKEVSWRLTTEDKLRAHLAGMGVADVDGVVDVWRRSATERVDEAVRIATEVIRSRIDEFGVKEPVIQAQGNDSLLIQLPGVVDRERVLNIIEKTAFLEFRLVEEDSAKVKAAEAGTVPEGYEFLPDQDDPNVKYLVFQESPITGLDIDTAISSMDMNMMPSVNLRLNGQGTKKFARLTRENVGKRLAIVIDGKVKSAPQIREAIPSGNAQITGRFTVERAKDLALVLNAGALPCPFVKKYEETVGPLLGADSVRRGVSAIVLGAVLVVIFMLVYYFLGGVVAIICLLLDILFILGGLCALGATLTLPGIAGMILTLGMAVDANVLIFERIREEFKNGRPISLAFKNGFEKAKRTIFDANLTTLIAAFFLFIYGTGPIRGFATTLSLGIIASIFTAVFVGRMIFAFFLNTSIKKFPMLELVKSPRIQFIRYRNICLLISFIVIAIGGWKFFSLKDDMYGIDFKGGQILKYRLAPVPQVDEVRRLLARQGLTGITLQKYKDVKGIEGGILIKSKEDVSDIVEASLKKEYETVEALNITTIGPSVGKILKHKALLAVFLSIVGILIYVGFRFKHFDFALAGIIALFHDVFVSVAFLAFSGQELSLLTVTALLTIAGYSINDTIVVYDRIREIAPRMHKASLREIVNTAINQTFSRTIITSLTTIMVVVSIYFLGGQALHAFSFTLLVGFIAGTYSSIYIASPLVLLFHKGRV